MDGQTEVVKTFLGFLRARVPQVYILVSGSLWLSSYRCLFLSLSYLMMQRLTFPFPFVHHQTHDWLLSVLECHCVAASRWIRKEVWWWCNISLLFTAPSWIFPGFHKLLTASSFTLRYLFHWTGVYFTFPGISLYSRLHRKERNNSGCKVRNVWKVEQLLTVETRTYLMMLLSFRFLASSNPFPRCLFSCVSVSLREALLSWVLFRSRFP